MPSDRSTISGWIQPEQILFDADASDRAQVLRSLAAAIGNTHALDPAAVFRALERREQAASTALGDGLAIPHARIAGLDRPRTLYLRTRTGIAFGAPDGLPVRDFVSIMVPADGDRQDHLELLALIAHLFADRQFRVGLEQASDAAAAAAHFRAGVDRLAPADRRR